MTGSAASVVTPYSRFLECQERRRRIGAELMVQNRLRTIEADAMPEAAETASLQTLNDTH
jgi:hypothetical protein